MTACSPETLPARAAPVAVADAVATVTAPLSQLSLDGRNPRAHAAAEDAEALADSIEALGLLQPLVGVRSAGGAVTVLDGRRRLAALALLVLRGVLDDDAPVPVRLLAVDATDPAAVAAAVAANVQRVALTATQEARAYRASVDAFLAVAGVDDTPAPIAATARAFGVSERHVRQRLALADLAAPVFAALDAGALTLDAAKLYARAPQARQEATFARLGADASKWAVRRALEEGGVACDDPLALFVGEAAYTAAGGAVSVDLFDADGVNGGGLWLDRSLAESLAADKLAAVKAEVEAEGWALVVAAPPNAGVWCGERVVGEDRKPTKAEAAELKRLSAALEAAQDALDGVEYGTAREGELEGEVATLEQQLRALERSLTTFSAADKTRAAAFVTFDDHTGALEVQRGVKITGSKAPPEARALRDAFHARDVDGARPHKGGDDDSGAAKGAADDKPRDDGRAFTHAAEQALQERAGAALSAALRDNPNVALAALTAQLARVWLDALGDDPVGATGPSYDVLQLTAHGAFFVDDKDPTAHAFRALVCEVEAAGGSLEGVLAGWSRDALVNALAVLTAPHVASAYASPTKRARAAALGRACATPPRPTEAATLDLLKQASATALDGFLVELGLEPGAKESRAAKAARVADAAAAVGWVPPLVREICGLDWTPPQPDQTGKPAQTGKRSKAKDAKAAKADPPAKPRAAPKRAVRAALAEDTALDASLDTGPDTDLDTGPDATPARPAGKRGRKAKAAAAEGGLA